MALYCLTGLMQNSVIKGATVDLYNNVGIDNYVRNAAGVIQYQTQTNPSTGAVTVITDAAGNPIPFRYAHGDAGAVWTIDLNNVPSAKTTPTNTGAANDTYRRIYIRVRGNATDINLKITDSAHTGTDTQTPVIIWLDGWTWAATAAANGNQNSTVTLSGDLTDQEIFIFASGVTIDASNAHMRGCIVLDDVSAGLTVAAGRFTLDGSLVWKNGITAPFQLANIDYTYNALLRLRPIAPRFLLVDAQSKVTY
jgi:hypothetical protein